MPGYDAVFTDGLQMRTVGPFDNPAEADEYGSARHGEQFDYLGCAERTGRVELDQVIGAMQVSADRPEHGWNGVVTRWADGATHGFITDRERRSWFVSRDDLPEGLSALDEDTDVCFSGSPHPKPGKKYPQAFSVASPTPAPDERRDW
jgi:cold shock CspA family protein